MCKNEKESLLNNTEVKSKIIDCLLLYAASQCFAYQNTTDYVELTKKADQLYIQTDRIIANEYNFKDRVIFNNLRNKISENTTIKDLIELIEKAYSK